MTHREDSSVTVKKKRHGRRGPGSQNRDGIKQEILLYKRGKVGVIVLVHVSRPVMVQILRLCELF